MNAVMNIAMYTSEYQQSGFNSQQSNESSVLLCADVCSAALKG